MSQNDGRIGYRRPPKHTQFKPGQSGNPQGRKPLFASFEADLLDELNAEISIREKGGELKISKQRAVINALVTAAISGNVRASSALLAIVARASPPRAEHDPESTAEADDQLVRSFERRQRRARTSESTPTKKPAEGG
jgi:hypothetical protein